MNWLNAILAFSLAMIVFCTIVSALTELIHELWERRELGLEWMLQRLYSDMLQPYARQLTAKIAAGGPTIPNGDLKDFLGKMSKNSSTSGGRDVPLATLSFGDFVERLAGTAVGQQLLVAAKQKLKPAEEMLTDLGRAFARYESDATTYFA
ncbi:MAG: hypothetical protein HY270_01600, partial [Deltaproteobacteria bacterium]|nr:hypothetical protein [Deltaproteobacteria bacterium]